VLEVARTPRTEQCARPARFAPRPSQSLAKRVRTEAVELARRPSSQCIDLVLCRLHAVMALRRTAKAP
jgi:hypothetical protein